MGKDARILAGIGILTVIIVIAAAFTIGNQPAANEEQATLGEAQVKLLERENSYTVGPENAKVQVVEFADFQCPACAAAHPILLRVKDEYKDQVEFVFRHYPLQVHKNARTAAMAAEAAGAQGKFWEMHDVLFENQQEWAEEGDALSIFTKYAEEIELDVEKFTNDVKNNAFEQKIQTDMSDGNQIGINSTPTFIINNQAYPGVLPYEVLKEKIDSELSK